MADKLNCSLTLLRSREINEGLETRDFLLRRRLEAEADFCEVRVAVVGNVDAGKSTLLGTVLKVLSLHLDRLLDSLLSNWKRRPNPQLPRQWPWPRSSKVISPQARDGVRPNELRWK